MKTSAPFLFVRIPGILGLLWLVLNAACVGPDQRIRAHQERFDTYSAEDQARIRAGDIAVGFDEGQVSLAKGQPTERHTTEKDGKTLTRWVYTKRALVPAPGAPGTDSIASPFGYPEPGPQPLQAPPPVYADEPTLIIEFVNGHVTGWHAPP